MTVLWEDDRFFSFDSGNAFYVYDAHVHTIVKPERSGSVHESLQEYLSWAKGLPDQEAPDLRSRNRISNLKLSLSGQCNLACSYCFRHSGMPEIENPETAKEAIDRMVEDFGSRAKRYTVSFNLTSEPFLKWRLLDELIHYADIVSHKIGKPIDWYVLTNGTIFNTETDGFIENFLSRTKRLCVSLDGPAHIHDANRRNQNGNGTHQNVLAFIDKWKSHVSSLEAQATLTPSITEPLVVIDYLLALGFNRIITTTVREDRNIDQINADQRSGYDRLFERLTEDLQSGQMDLVRTLRLDHSLRPLWKILSGVKISWRCYWGHTHIVADGLGRFYPCDSVIGSIEYQAGDVKNGINWKVFHNDLSTLQRFPCKQCWARYLCGGTCYVSGIKKADDPAIIDPYECSLNKYLCQKNLELLSLFHDKPNLQEKLKQALFS